jgi:hypothetical protein
MAWSRLAMLPELIDCQAAMTAELVIGHPCKAVAKNKKIKTHQAGQKPRN